MSEKYESRIRLMREDEKFSSSNLKFKQHSSKLDEEPIVKKSSGRTVLPGDLIIEDTNFMRGHGTYIDKEKHLVSSVAGCVIPTNKLISVIPPKTRYNGEIGDIIVGRITEVKSQSRKWKVDTNSRLESTLLLSSVNLPGGELRRKTAEDELMMRSYFSEADLISAEVQSIFADGSLSLHTRSLKYGKLGQGVLVKVSPSLIERRKTHIHNLECGAHLILANNGYIWITQIVIDQGSGGFAINMNAVPLEDREVISRLRNCILCLSKYNILINDTSVMYCYQVSSDYDVKDLLKSEVTSEIVFLTKQKLYLET